MCGFKYVCASMPKAMQSVRLSPSAWISITIGVLELVRGSGTDKREVDWVTGEKHVCMHMSRVYWSVKAHVSFQSLGQACHLFVQGAKMAVFFYFLLYFSKVEMSSLGHLSAHDRNGPFSLFLITGEKASPPTQLIRWVPETVWC